jgi:hypothetical protein
MGAIKDVALEEIRHRLGKVEGATAFQGFLGARQVVSQRGKGRILPGEPVELVEERPGKLLRRPWVGSTGVGEEVWNLAQNHPGQPIHEGLREEKVEVAGYTKLLG